MLSPCGKCRGGLNSKHIKKKIKIPGRIGRPHILKIKGQGNKVSDDQGDLVFMIEYPLQDDQNNVRVLSGGVLLKALAVPWEDALMDKEIGFRVFPSSDEICLKLDHNLPTNSRYKLEGLGMLNGSDLLVQVIHTLPPKMNEGDRRKVAEILCRYRDPEKTGHS